MYAITNDASFQEVSTLRDKLVDITEEEDHPVVLVGNKCDLEDDRQVQRAQAQGLAEKYKWTWIEASAKTKTNVTETFQEIVRCIRKYRSSAPPPTDPVGDKGDKTPAKASSRRGGCVVL
eukprot:TRINITY_DN8087_c0_g1_i3.p1 TRINITY_DN8087_c0_g1~~TRINITY_DN8087_c0_g1_i3.p1  ORF type:complete len:120 (+),score=14.01 TRINITY_DN8087_c0_g1_i3:410-769(+)